jgi:hypothetical protein
MEKFPYYIYTSGGGALRYFNVVLNTGETVKAYVDPSNQYGADGKTWRRADNRQSIPTHHVASFEVIDGLPA